MMSLDNFAAEGTAGKGVLKNHASIFGRLLKEVEEEIILCLTSVKQYLKVEF